MAAYSCTVGIVGAWFAGLAAYISITRRCPWASVKLFDQRDQFTFIPSLHETLGSPERLKELQFPLADVYGDDFHHTRITHVTKDCVITTAEWDTRACEYIVIATGSYTNFHGLAPYRAFAHTIRYPEDIPPLNDALRTAKHTTVIGGWYTGIEVAAILAEKQIGGKIRLIHNQDKFLAQYAHSIGHTTQRWLETHEVELVMNAKVTALDAHSVTLEDGQVLPSDATIVNTWIIINDDQHVPEITFTQAYTANENDRIYDCGDVAIHGLLTTAHNAYVEWQRVGSLIADRIQNISRSYPPLQNYSKLAVALGRWDGIMVINNWWFYMPLITWMFKRAVEKKILFEFRNKILLPF